MEEFGFEDMRENHRPEWLQSSTGQRLELDFFLPSLGIAIEVQGAQHFKFSSVFHRTFDDFIAQTKRDAEKKLLCKSHGIKLLEVCDEDGLSNALSLIRRWLGKTETVKKNDDNDDFVAFISRRRPRLGKRIISFTKLLAKNARLSEVSSSETKRKLYRSRHRKYQQAINQILVHYSPEIQSLREQYDESLKNTKDVNLEM